MRIRRLLGWVRSQGQRPAAPTVRVVPVDAGWTPEQCLNLILSLQPGQRLSFFDPDFPSVSDPGGYVQVARSPDGGWSRYTANHGWHTELESTTLDALAHILHRHRAAQGPGVQLTQERQP